MSAAPTDYPPAVLEEADLAMRAAISAAHRGGSYPEAVTLAGAQAYAAVLARYTVAARLTRSPGGVLVLDSPGEPIPAAVLSDTEPPPVDEDAAAEARAYERGRADAIRDAAEWLRKAGRGLAAWHIEQKERDSLAVKRGAAKS